MGRSPHQNPETRLSRQGPARCRVAAAVGASRGRPDCARAVGPAPAQPVLRAPAAVGGEARSPFPGCRTSASPCPKPAPTGTPSSGRSRAVLWPEPSCAASRTARVGWLTALVWRVQPRWGCGSSRAVPGPAGGQFPELERGLRPCLSGRTAAAGTRAGAGATDRWSGQAQPLHSGAVEMWAGGSTESARAPARAGRQPAPAGAFADAAQAFLEELAQSLTAACSA